MRRAVAAACALRACHRLRIVRLDSTRSEIALEVGRTPEIVQGITTLAAAVTVSFSAH
jgi:hypothetical protein